MRGGHCVKVWTKKQQVVSLSTAECETVRRSQNRVRGMGNSERDEGLGHCMCELAFGCHSDDVLGQPQRAGQGTTRRHGELVDTRSLQGHQNVAGSNR